WIVRHRRWPRRSRRRGGERDERLAPVLVFQKRQGAAPPASGLILEAQEQLATFDVAEFPVDKTVKQAIVRRTRGWAMLNWQVHSITSTARTPIIDSRRRFRARCSRASTALSLIP